MADRRLDGKRVADVLRKMLNERDDAIRLLEKVVTGGNPTGAEWQRINELIRGQVT